MQTNFAKSQKVRIKFDSNIFCKLFILFSSDQPKFNTSKNDIKTTTISHISPKADINTGTNDVSSCSSNMNLNNLEQKLTILALGNLFDFQTLHRKFNTKFNENGIEDNIMDDLIQDELGGLKKNISRGFNSKIREPFQKHNSEKYRKSRS